jgi:hypothetical protein
MNIVFNITSNWGDNTQCICTWQTGILPASTSTLPHEDEDRSVQGPVDGLSWLWWVIDNVVWIESWPSIAGVDCGLICVGAGEEWARKVYALRGLRGVERQVVSVF